MTVRSDRLDPGIGHLLRLGLVCVILSRLRQGLHVKQRARQAGIGLGA